MADYQSRTLSFSRSLHQDKSQDIVTAGCETYKRRWYILIVFSLIAFMQAGVWNTWGPIAGSAELVFGWTDGTIALLENWGPIAYVVSFVFFSWLMDVKGLRVSVLVTAFLVCAGCGLRCITSEPEAATILIHFGQILVDLGAPISMGAPPALSAAWFPPNQRATATAISTLFSYFGIACSFIVGPLLQRDHSTSGGIPSHNISGGNSSHLTSDVVDVSFERNLIMRLMYIEFGITAVLLLCVLIYFPAKPPKPPSFSAAKKKIDYVTGGKQLLRNGQFWILNILYGATTGVFSGWGGVLSVNLMGFNLGQDTAGWIGFYANIAGAGFGLLMARFADYFTGKMKAFLVALFFGSTAAFLWFSLLCEEIISFNKASLYIAAILGGCFINGSIPLFYELTVETTYPIAEGIPMSILTTSNHVACLLFLAAMMIPGIGTAWMNWCMLGTCAVCVPFLVIFREKYSRLAADAVRKHARRRTFRISQADQEGLLEEVPDENRKTYNAINS